MDNKITGCPCCDEMNSPMFIRVLSFGVHLYLVVVELCMKLVGIEREGAPLLYPLLSGCYPFTTPHKPPMVIEGPQPIECLPCICGPNAGVPLLLQL